MVEGLIGKKVGMTQIFSEDGSVVPVTVIKAGPCAVVQKKSEKKEGYSAVQLAFMEDKLSKKISKPLKGHLDKAGVSSSRILREFQFDDSSEVQPGSQLFVDIFQEGEKVDVIGTSKGKGFAGVMRRWGFHGGKSTHGSRTYRKPGAIGASATPAKVIKGRKLPGQMGHQRVKNKNLQVVETDKDNNFLLVKGSIPGAKGDYVMIKKAYFRPEKKSRKE
ncbi:50S ribosomal protein L3 [bacterium]|nr:50S ribosomal protein L3 [bacterium]